ncbi:MAG: hypothetical protein MOGMAGMI_02593 [Candidatus Omnitrophica bacterium]|nr:hypothetical protein [Candidatus Omnitrophota bacterium]
MVFELGLFLISIVFSIIGYFLRQKDAEQGKLIEQVRTDCSTRDAKQDSNIALLFSKHDADVSALQDLRLQIARDHYQKEELDARFTRLEAAFQKGFDDLGKKFDRLSDALMQHMHEDSGKERRQ